MDGLAALCEQAGLLDFEIKCQNFEKVTQTFH
jgi:hypothetical protein